MHKLYDIYLESIRPTKLFTIPLMVICAIGMLLGGTTELTFLSQVGPSWLWTVLLVFLAGVRFVDLFVKRLSGVIEYVIQVTIVWLWTLILIADLNTSPYTGMGLMYIIPIIIELWFISRTVDNNMDKLTHKPFNRK